MPGAVGRGIGNCLMGTEFQWKMFWRWMAAMAAQQYEGTDATDLYTLNGQNGKFCVMYIFAH